MIDSGVQWVTEGFVIEASCTSLGAPAALENGDALVVGFAEEGLASTSVADQRCGGGFEVGRVDGGCSGLLAGPFSANTMVFVAFANTVAWLENTSRIVLAIRRWTSVTPT